MICPKCGQNVSDDASFCNKCGTDLRTKVKNDTAASSSNTPLLRSNVKHPLRWWMWLLAGIGAVLIISAIAYLGAKKPSVNSPLIASIQWDQSNYALNITNINNVPWYGFKITLSTDTDKYANPNGSQNLEFPPGRVLTFSGIQEFVDADGNYIGAGAGIWNPGTYTISMSTKLSPNGSYVEVVPAPGYSATFQVNNDLLADFQYPTDGDLVITNDGSSTWYAINVTLNAIRTFTANIPDCQIETNQQITLQPNDFHDQSGSSILPSDCLNGIVGIDNLYASASNPYSLPQIEIEATAGGPFVTVTLQTQNNTQTTSTLSQTSQFLTYTDSTAGDRTQGVSIDYPEGWLLSHESQGNTLQFQSPVNVGSTYACQVDIMVPVLNQPPVTLKAYVLQAINNDSISDGVSGDYFKTEGSPLTLTVAGYPAYEVMFSEKRSGLVFNAMDVYIQISNNAIYYFRAAVFEPASYADYSSIIQEMLNSLNFSAQ
jgi:hypothetical protein